MLRKSYTILFAVLILLVAACGGDSEPEGGDTQATEADGGVGEPDATDPPDDGAGAEPEATQPPDDGGGAEAPEVTEMGSFTVDGTEFAVNLLNRCIPFGGEDGSTIDLQPIAQGQGAGLNLYGDAEQLEVSVQGTAVEEIGGTNSFGTDTFDGGVHENAIDGDRWSGSATLTDSYGSDATVEVTWDVMIPEEVNDCSL